MLLYHQCCIIPTTTTSNAVVVNCHCPHRQIKLHIKLKLTYLGEFMAHLQYCSVLAFFMSENFIPGLEKNVLSGRRRQIDFPSWQVTFICTYPKQLKEQIKTYPGLAKFES